MRSEYEHRDYNPLSVQDLIDELKKIKDRDKRVRICGPGEFKFVHEQSGLDYIVIMGEN